MTGDIKSINPGEETLSTGYNRQRSMQHVVASKGINPIAWDDILQPNSYSVSD